MKFQNLRSYFFKLLQPRRIFILVFLVVGIYLLPLGSKPEFVEHNGQIIAVSQPSPILRSVYPEGIYASCGQGGTGTNCHTGCCSAGACVVCPPREEEDRPPSISASLNCSNTGNNGWCIGTLTLNLNASDPQGANVLITGTLNGNNFACPSGATSCSIPVTQETATGAITYRVDASTGLAAAGSASYKLDATTPALNGSLSGVAGANNWYRSNVTLNVTSSDSLSGLAATTASINGGTAAAVTGPLSFSDGISTVVVTATDNAGNTTQTTQTIQVDTITPSLSTALSGTSGANGWYVSTVTITPSASDAGSGLALLEVTTDGGPWSTVSGPLLFTDGIHTYQFRATDTAGNVTQTVQQTVKVDTTTPSISLNISGTTGKSGWYVSIVTVTPILSDSTAGIAALEATVDNGAWSIVSGPLSFTDGLHSYQFKVTDQAGNSTTIPIQNLKVDTIAPFIDMTAELSLGETVYYALEDYGSGLQLYRAVIEDDAEQYQKIVWLDLLAGNKLMDQIRWDGKFKDGTPAGIGEYFITLKISDVAGNETMKTAVVSVNFLSFLQDIPTFTAPESTTANEAEGAVQADSPTTSQFGGENNSNPESQDPSTGSRQVVTTNEGGNGIIWPEGTMGEVEFSMESTTTTNGFPLDPGILWGAAATALAGATLAEWERQREEERKRAEEAQQQKRENTEKRKAQKAQEDAVRERWAAEAEAKTGGGKGLNSPVQVVKPMPPGLSPEAQAAFLHGGTSATSWIGSNASSLQAQYVADLNRKKEREREKAAYDHRMGEHGGQDVVGAWKAEQQNPEKFNLDDIISNGLDIVSFLRDDFEGLITNSAIVVSTANWLASPKLDPNPTWRTIQEQQLLVDARRGLVSMDQYIDELSNITNSSRPSVVNYTTLSTLFGGVKSVVSPVSSLVSLGFSLFGAATNNEDIENIGNVSGGTLSIAQGVQTFGNQQLVAQSVGTTFGKLTTVGIFALGLAQFGSSSTSLIVNEDINPVTNGGWDNEIWIERVGVATQGIGGAFLAAGAACALIPGGQPVAAVLIPAGAAFLGVGSVMSNWGWVTDTATDISSSVQNWWNNSNTITPSGSSGIQPVPVITPSATPPAVTPVVSNTLIHEPSSIVTPSPQNPPPPSAPTSGTPQP